VIAVAPDAVPDGRDPLEEIDILVMARVPVVGTVKSRLAARIGAAPACNLYAAMIADLSFRLGSEPRHVTWVWTPAGLPIPFVGQDVAHAVQGDGDLGQRMHQAISERWRVGKRPVLVLGADVPHVEVEWLRQGAELLLRGVDVVLGPAEDGGYWSIGMREPRPGLFTGIAWGTSGVLVATLARARELALTVAELPGTFDLDEWADIERVRPLVTATPARFPALAPLLGAI
jgi:uncharacterized protein